uniref:Uncharacterized protein n=1 Tax=Romanomermis culicivorax TaxID=13658 RepID=A0A915I0L3_ROMCU
MFQIKHILLNSPMNDHDFFTIELAKEEYLTVKMVDTVDARDRGNGALQRIGIIFVDVIVYRNDLFFLRLFFIWDYNRFHVDFFVGWRQRHIMDMSNSLDTYYKAF